MLCPKCNQEIPEETKVCPNCQPEIEKFDPVRHFYIKPQYRSWFIISSILTIFLGFVLGFYIPNYLTQKSRSKVTLVRYEMRMIATALTSYYVDNGNYPRPDYDSQNNPIVPNSITSPISYIPSVPKDPFSVKGNQTYRFCSGWEPYKTWVTGFFIIASNGPDKSISLDVTTYRPKQIWFKTYGVLYEYDHTNGTTSNGDIFITGPYNLPLLP